MPPYPHDFCKRSNEETVRDQEKKIEEKKSEVFVKREEIVLIKHKIGSNKAILEKLHYAEQELLDTAQKPELYTALSNNGRESLANLKSPLKSAGIGAVIGEGLRLGGGYFLGQSLGNSLPVLGAKLLWNNPVETAVLAGLGYLGHCLWNKEAPPPAHEAKLWADLKKELFEINSENIKAYNAGEFNDENALNDEVLNTLLKSNKAKAMIQKVYEVRKKATLSEIEKRKDFILKCKDVNITKHPFDGVDMNIFSEAEELKIENRLGKLFALPHKKTKPRNIKRRNSCSEFLDGDLDGDALKQRHGQFVDIDFDNRPLVEVNKEGLEG